MHHNHSRVDDDAVVNRPIDDAHAWLVDHAQGITDEVGVPIPVEWRTLNRMRAVKAKYGDSENADLWPPSEIERRMMSEYDILMALYANRDTAPEPASNFGSWALIVAILAPWVVFAIGYGLWRWLN